MGNSRFILFLLIVTASIVLQGQNFRYTTYHGDGIPFEKMNQTLQDHKGFLWVASDNGLYRFDGQNFEDFNLSLKSRHIRSIVVQSVDTIFFANDSGIFKLFYLEEQPQIEPFLDAGEGVEVGYVNQLFVDSQNNLWANSSKGAALRINIGSKQIEKFPWSETSKGNQVFFEEDENQTIWALRPQHGLYRFDKTTNNFVLLPGFEHARHFTIDKATIHLVGSKIERFSIEVPSLLKKQGEIDTNGHVFNHIAPDLNGTYFTSSDNSLFTISEENGLQKVFGSNDPHRVEELPFQGIRHLNFSRDQLRLGGKIWISTSKGLWLLRTSYFKSVEGIPHDNVFSVATGTDQEVLISQGSVFQINENRGDRDFEVLQGLGRVSGIAQYKDNSYFGTANAQIIRFKEQKKQHIYDLRDRGGGIFYMAPDSSGDIWFCQAPSDKPLRGVGKLLSNGQLKFYGASEGLDTRILVIDEGGRSELYAAGIGPNSYLFKYNRKDDSFENKSLSLPPDVSTNFEVHDISVDPLGIVWMGTTDGLFKYDTESVKRIDLGAFTNNEIRAVHAHENGGVWIATDTDGLIYRYPTGHSVQFDEESGTPSKIASYRCIASEAGGTLWVGTAEGAVYSSLPAPEPLKTTQPRIGEIYINGNKEDTSRLRLSEKEVLQLGLTTLTYPAKGVRYQYKMVDQFLSEKASQAVQWSAPFSDGTIELQNLSSGDYTVLVRAQKPGGYGWSDPSTISVVVKKSWYRTWWGVGLLLVIGLIALWYFARQWGQSKTESLSSALSKKQHDLEDKQAQLAVKEGQLKSTGANLFMLNRLLAQLPKNEPWEKVLPHLKKLVELPTGIDAFEIGFVKNNELHFMGYKRKGGRYLERKLEFNDKENLQSYALHGTISLLINDYETEVAQYIGGKAPKEHAAMILVPFGQLGTTDAVFCAYAEQKAKFTNSDLALVQVLVKFLSLTVTDQPS